MEHNFFVNELTDYINRFHCRESVINVLVEGLIASVNSNKVVEMLKKEFHIPLYNIETDWVEDEQNAEKQIIFIILDKSVDNNTVGNLKQRMKTFGYFLAKKPEIRQDNTIQYIFEPKFTNVINDKIRKECKFLYHITPSINVKKIQKNGLVPKSKNSIYNYPDRIYLMKGDQLDDIQKLILKNIIICRNMVKTRWRAKHPESKQYNILTIDVEKIPLNVMFYTDAFADGSIFTHDNIPPSAIAKIEPFEY